MWHTPQDWTHKGFSIIVFSVVLLLRRYGQKNTRLAQVAELADALASGASARKGVGVQVPSCAQGDVCTFTLKVFVHYRTETR